MFTFTLQLDSAYAAPKKPARIVAQYTQHADGWLVFKDTDNKVVAEYAERGLLSVTRTDQPHATDALGFRKDFDEVVDTTSLSLLAMRGWLARNLADPYPKLDVRSIHLAGTAVEITYENEDGSDRVVIMNINYGD